eukprot:scaffold2635_cov443-Pavlova_lutheri.AAC.1
MSSLCCRTASKLRLPMPRSGRHPFVSSRSNTSSRFCALSLTQEVWPSCERAQYCTAPAENSQSRAPDIAQSVIASRRVPALRWEAGPMAAQRDPLGTVSDLIQSTV